MHGKRGNGDREGKGQRYRRVKRIAEKMNDSFLEGCTEGIIAKIGSIQLEKKKGVYQRLSK